ncbi:MAG: FAD-dependent oxidoreductase [Lentisphaeria bacterium]|nr:FAD-dependent oxidoreductase [Lentisphaeria bacterium]
MKLFIDAETFDDIGNWVIDTQSYETNSFAYLLAHGIGKPVSDARTHTVIEKAGVYRAFVRTRNWSAVWGRGTPAGKFLLKIDGVPFESTLGTASQNWSWQFAGTMKLSAGKHTISLEDLTGFDARCDAVLLTDEADFVPPEDHAELIKFRRECCKTVIENDPEVYDLLIIGGGFAGLCMGISAKKLNLKVKVIHDRPVGGGCGSSEVRVWVGGDAHTGIYPNIGNVAAAISPVAGIPGMKKEKRFFEDERKTILLDEPAELLLNEIAVSVEMEQNDPQKIRSIVTRSVRTGRETRRFAKLFADCSGDAFVSRKTNCRTMYGCEGRDDFNESLGLEKASTMVMGHSTLWETRRMEHPVDFPDIDWGIEFNDQNALARLNCCWDWECGQFKNQLTDIEYIRDYGIMTCYANWSFLKNRSINQKQWRNMELEWLSPIGGKRESYRVVGDLILTQNDIQNDVIYPDGSASATWSIDLHFPDPENMEKFGEPFQSCAYHLGLRKPYPIPYRCLYAADCSNLLLGGRCISATHVAFSCIRVMRTCGCLAEVAAMAAEICTRHNCTPREVYQQYLDELKDAMNKGVPEMGLPCAWGTGYHEAYHFMRPVGSVGNKDDENCWIYLDENGTPEKPLHPELQKVIVKLNVNQQSAKKTPF